MNLLRRIFGGVDKTSSRNDADPNVITFFVKTKKCGAIARVRIDMRNDLSLDDDGENYIVRKSVVDNVCYGNAELEIRFDANRKAVSRQVENGELVTGEAYEEQEKLRISPRIT